jgi:hypothetical protein
MDLGRHRVERAEKQTRQQRALGLFHPQTVTRRTFATRLSIG